METHVRTFKFMSIPQFTVSKNVCVSGGGGGGGGEDETNSVLETFLSRQLTVTSIWTSISPKTFTLWRVGPSRMTFFNDF